MNRYRFILIAAALALFSQAVSSQDPETDARAEYESVLNEIQKLQGRVPPSKLIDTAESGMLDIIDKYPGTTAAGSARVMLGQIYSSIGKSEAAVAHLTLYLESDFKKEPKEEYMAMALLGNAHLAAEEFGEAEKAYRRVLGAGDVDPQIKKMASGSLERIGTLKKLKIGSETIPFTVKDTEGRSISPSDYKGKVILLDFWATWCSPCRMEMPNVKKVYDRYHGKGFDIIGVSFDNNGDAFERYIKEEDLEWRQIFDGKGWKAEVGRLYAVSSIPTTYLLDRQGRIRYKNLRGDDLEKAVVKLLEE
jgi:peroxiredoxin